jgi:hypothetical protein
MRDKYFEVQFTAYRDKRPRTGDVVAIYAGEKPRKNADGTTSMSLRFPALIVSEYTADGKEFAEKVAELLEENAHRFFSSAAHPEAELKSPQGDEVDAEQYKRCLTLIKRAREKLSSVEKDTEYLIHEPETPRSLCGCILCELNKHLGVANDS